MTNEEKKVIRDVLQDLEWYDQTRHTDADEAEYYLEFCFKNLEKLINQ